MARNWSLTYGLLGNVIAGFQTHHFKAGPWADAPNRLGFGLAWQGTHFELERLAVIDIFTFVAELA